MNYNNVLIVNPLTDKFSDSNGFPGVTYYAYSYRQAVIDKAHELGYNVMILTDVTRESFETALQEHDPFMVLIMGHGKQNLVTGNFYPDVKMYEIILRSGENEAQLADRVSYLFSCSAGATLGPAIMSAGGKEFIGYNKDFIFAVQNPFDPMTDAYAKPFFNSSNAIEFALLEGKSAGEAYQVGLSAFDSEISKWSKSDDVMAKTVVGDLIHNRNSLVYGARDGMTMQVEESQSPMTGLVMLSIGVLLFALSSKNKALIPLALLPP